MVVWVSAGSCLPAVHNGACKRTDMQSRLSQGAATRDEATVLPDTTAHN